MGLPIFRLRSGPDRVEGFITSLAPERLPYRGPIGAPPKCLHGNGPILCQTLVLLIPEWFAVVKVTHGPVMCRLWAGLWLFYFRN